ncbi:alpha-amylase family glycosyl hydrolase [Anaerosacchariphilus polymeriproducens]|uniref:Alpha-amylase n=1 Tax=Anaerosacchariphilus polymeriproducens TaxID=1812858 RepID=A0A371AQY1_9FIRM|nr:alpha-amylase family glycosyl hydrolase [Anaerosacchariphilus polymeriproducens]RDU21969.1 alpha-amylase [Anaerosacchariphilus polymeriproducens]
MKRRQKLYAIILTLVLAVSFTPNVISNQFLIVSQAAYGLPAKTDDGVIFHAYMWKFADIQSNLKAFADAGYNSIQVSPVQGIKPGKDWYMFYQPCNYRIGNPRLGDENAFKSLCAEADKYGIKIIVDAVLNHVADNGNDGQWYDGIDSSLKRSDFYHNQGSCKDYTNRNDVTQKNVGNLPDLATQRHDVQDMQISFLNNCIADGADGFRFDAAKHIETNRGEDSGQSCAGDYWDRVLGSLNNKNKLYLYGEVLPDKADNDEVYRSYFDITAHGYGGDLRNAVFNKDLTNLMNIKHYDHNISPKEALCYLENHDDYEHGVTTNMTEWQRKMGWSILNARAQLTPLYFARPNDTLWKDKDLVAVNKFHNAMAGQNEYLRYPRKEAMVIDRGNTGSVIVNVGDGFHLDTPTNLKDGTYANKGNASCTVRVSGGRMTGNIPGGSVVVFY